MPKAAIPDKPTVSRGKRADVQPDAFDAAYRTLNVEQKFAVDTIEGPVMVVAGPGTGKTQVLATRVAHILKKTHARPANILCLTFSNAGATAMRERLRQLIGGDAYGVTVNTVHGFCDGIIRRNASAFSEWSSRKPLSDLERYKKLQKIIDSISGSALINAKNPYDRIPAIIQRISDCKREGKSLQDLHAVALEYTSRMEGKSKAGTKADAKNRLAARKFREFVDVFSRYQDALLESDTYDYDDMILTVLDTFEREEWLLLGLQERYQYILVDEAQDLNGAQWRIIERLTTYDAVPHDPNFFLVGDDDQSIYRFQGANLEHMLRFRDRFPAAPVIVLTENYRSTQPILDAAGRLIRQNEERLIHRIPGLTKDLKAHTREKGIAPALLRPPSDTAELWLIADLCEERIADGISPEEIAVLVQTNGELRPIYDVLRARNIPVIMQGKADLLFHPLVRQALTILRSLVTASEHTFLHALACACFGCHPADIARTIAAAREQKKSAREFLLGIESLSLPLSDQGTLLKARDTLLDLHQKVESRSVLETVEHALRASGLIPLAAVADPLDLAAVEAFFHYVKQHCLEQPGLTLHAFLRDLEWYADEHFAQLRLTYAVPHLVTSGVQLLTAHQSKGLEYHTVILSQFREKHWDERITKSGLSLPEDLLFGWEPEQKRFEKHQDERRVAYVAMTRAKRELLMLCPKEFVVGERARPVAPSAFFAEAGPLPESEATLRDLERASILVLQPERSLDAEMKAYLTDRLKTFALSPSSLATFLEDPVLFMRIHLLHLPEERKEKDLLTMAYGSAVHWALREWAVAVRRQSPVSVEKFLQDFESHLTERNVLTKKQYADLIGIAKDALPAYFSECLEGRTPVIHTVEQDYRAVLADPSDPRGPGIPLKGKIDRIDLASKDSGSAIVIDFKTGAPKSPSEIRGGLEQGCVSRESRKGDNFRQLVFYALLLEQAEPLLRPENFILEFTGEREADPISRPFTLNEEEKESLRTLIRQVWRKIIALDFTPL
ncbi:ATP-dependent helicase [Candidatus Peregrinibacteria bacterium]|nr:ATP-dependent helicase [Candidatus Peregrinibacteria bacterium]